MITNEDIKRMASKYHLYYDSSLNAIRNKFFYVICSRICSRLNGDETKVVNINAGPFLAGDKIVYSTYETETTDLEKLERIIEEKMNKERNLRKKIRLKMITEL